MSNTTRDDFISSIARIAASVYDFHERFDVPSDGRANSDDSLSVLRRRLPYLIEETGEHAKELNKGNLWDAALELADVTFVALGSVLMLNACGNEACHAVAAKNDAKTAETHVYDASSGKLVRRVSDG